MSADPVPAESGRRFRRLGPVAGTIERILAIVLTLLGAAWALELQFYIQPPIFKEQYIAVIIVVALAGVFIGVKARASEGGGTVPWYDWVAVCLSTAVGGYIAVNYPDIVDDLGSLDPIRYVLGGLALVLVLEATRRTTGWTLVILGLACMFYAKFSSHFPGILNVPEASWSRLAVYLYLDSNGMMGTPINVTATIIIPFILFGRVLYAARGDRTLTDFALATMGSFRGGPAKVAVIASSLFGTMSGSAVSNAVMVGPVTIPMMKRAGYPGHIAAGIEAVASTGGQIMPPVMGITAFLIAEFLAVPYSDVVIAAVIPAVLYYFSVFIHVDLEAAKRGIAGIRREELPRLRDIGLKGAVFLIPVAILLWGLFSQGWQPGKAAMAAVIATIVVAYLLPATRPTLRSLISAAEETGRGLLDLVVITLLAGLVIGMLQLSGLSFNFSLMLLSIAGKSMLVLLLMTAAVCIVLGMGMPTGVIYVMLAVLVGPALIKMGVVPMAAHLFLFYFGLMSMVTPPVCLATFATASIAKSDFWQTGWAGMRLAATAYVVPFVMVYQPGLVFEGSWQDIVLVTAKTVLGIVVLTAGMVGYLFRPVGTAARALLVLSGASIMLTPFGAAYAAQGLAAALALTGVTMAWEYRKREART